MLRGGPVARAVWLVSGLFLCAVGILCFLEARLGLPPWDVLHQGIARHTPLSFGAANEVVGLIVLTVAWALGARVWIGTVSNAVLIGGGLLVVGVPLAIPLAVLTFFAGFVPIVVCGAIVSISTVFEPTEVMLPTLSSAIHLTVVTPSAERLNEALAPATSMPFVTLSLLSIAGLVPSVE